MVKMYCLHCCALNETSDIETFMAKGNYKMNCGFCCICGNCTAKFAKKEDKVSLNCSPDPQRCPGKRKKTGSILKSPTQENGRSSPTKSIPESISFGETTTKEEVQEEVPCKEEPVPIMEEPEIISEETKKEPCPQSPKQEVKEETDLDMCLFCVKCQKKTLTEFLHQCFHDNVKVPMLAGCCKECGSIKTSFTTYDTAAEMPKLPKYENKTPSCNYKGPKCNPADKYNINNCKKC